jgi:hypothetical protein
LRIDSSISPYPPFFLGPRSAPSLAALERFA